MILRTRCPNCGATYRLQEPLPPEGKKYRCTCNTVITIAYPDSVRERIQVSHLDMGNPDAQVTQPVGTSPVTVPDIEPIPPIQDEATLQEPAEPAEDAPPQPSSAGKRTQPRAPRQTKLQLQARAARSRAEAHLSPPPEIPPMGPARPLPKSPFEDDASTLRRPPMTAGNPASEEESAEEDEPTVVEPMDRPMAAAMPLGEPDGEETQNTDLQASVPDSGSDDNAPGEPHEPEDPEAESPGPEEAAPTAPNLPAHPTGSGEGARQSRWARLPKLRWTSLLAAAAGLCIVLVGATAMSVVAYHSKGLPSVSSLADYSPPVVTVVKDINGVVIGEFYEQQRYVVPLEQIPGVVRDAFIAAEDAAFWEHSGLDFRGIARAMVKNVEEGRMAQGGSTITQQVARSFLLTREKKLARKLKEAILAYRIENNFSKEHILYLYLNQIYLGHGAYGVQAAAKLYFGKDVSELQLAEAAIIAGLPQAPARYSPNKNFRAAKDRQRYVLNQMSENGYISRKRADAAFAKEMTFVKKHDINLDYAPYYVEHVRRYLDDTYGHHATYNEGLQVTLPIDLDLQKEANLAIKNGVRYADKRIGYRGVINLEDEAAIEEQLVKIDHERTLKFRTYDPVYELPSGRVQKPDLPALQEGEYTRGVVAEVSKTWALVDVGSNRGLLPLDEFKWCHKVAPKESFKRFECERLDQVLTRDDLIEVRVVNTGENWRRTLGSRFKDPTQHPRLSMEQSPAPEGALLSARVEDGAVLAMVGGSSFTGSEFNRAVQSKRQVGSTFKPLVYTAALESQAHPHTPSTIIVDAPLVQDYGGAASVLWRPANAGGKYLGDTTFRRGLYMSRNIVTLKILQAIGVTYTVNFVKRFGFDNPLRANLAMGLGAEGLSLVEMVRAYTVFATLGDRRDLYFISEVKDRSGKVLEMTTHGALAKSVVPKSSTYIMTQFMRDVVRIGTARKNGKSLAGKVAGKTGTTNHFKDAWFIGFTPEVVTAVWMGKDDFTTMGRGQFGGDIALPAWIDYMVPALEKYPPGKFPMPPDVVGVRVDSRTGLRAGQQTKGSAWVPYKRGTAPTAYAPPHGQVDPAEFLSGEF